MAKAAILPGLKDQADAGKVAEAGVAVNMAVDAAGRSGAIAAGRSAAAASACSTPAH
ncbi:hypothetical protein [Hoeflea sp.]|uniref:hypothetical protein n=1 Tax=Hoeflea sp. TaxID=1940281 RepID=UPI0025C69780|nr:hypothetical protein [Hoeflea sp.]